MNVMVVDGENFENVMKFHKVKLQTQDFDLESKLCSVPLIGLGVVLGVQCLQSLDIYSTKQQKCFIKFKWKARNYKIHGFQPLRHMFCHLSIWRKLSKNGHHLT